jgi:hypothetical protein
MLKDIGSILGGAAFENFSEKLLWAPENFGSGNKYLAGNFR